MPNWFDSYDSQTSRVRDPVKASVQASNAVGRVDSASRTAALASLPVVFRADNPYANPEFIRRSYDEYC